MEQPDIASLFYSDDESGPAKAQAYAQALRGQQQMGIMGLLTGDKVLGNVGQQVLRGTQEQQDLIPRATNMRLQRAMEAEKARTEQEFRQSQERHMTAQDAISRAQLAQGRYSLSSPTPTSPGYVVDQKTGLARSLLEGPPGKPVNAGKDAEDLDKALKGLKEDLDPSRGRNGLFGQDQGLVTAADKVLALTRNPDGTRNYKLTVRQVPEMVQAVASMLSNGGHAAEAQMEKLNPHTAGMSLAQKLEYITGHPEEANAEDFVKQYAETAERERELARQRIRNVQLDRVSAHQGAYGRFKDPMKATARQYLSDLGDQDLDLAFQGKYDRNAKPAQPGAKGGGLTAAEAAELAALEKKYGGAK